MKPNNRVIHFFDLDGTLFNIDSRVWILDKEEPHKPIIRLDNFEINRILSGLYKKDNLKIQYNGEEYFISKNIFDRINKKKRINIERLGLSWIEFYDEKYINNTKVEFLMNNIKHLRGKDDIICLLSGRSNRERHADLLNMLRKKIEDFGLEIYKIYFVSDKFFYRSEDTVSLNKVHILLEHLVGLKIDNSKFVPFKQDWFNKVYFYDDDKMNIDYANDCQKILERVLKNSDDELFKIVVDRIKNNDLELFANLVTNNDINLFDIKRTKIRMPVKFPIRDDFSRKL